MDWLNLDRRLPAWSRKYQRNTTGAYRDQPQSKLNNYDIEIEDRLWSLWGSILPETNIIRGNQCRFHGNEYLAVYVVACCAACVFDLMNWTDHLLDRIVVNGIRYFRKSITSTKRNRFSLKSLNVDCSLESLKFVVYINHACTGKLYCKSSVFQPNLAEALGDFFKNSKYGIISSNGRSVLFGFRDGASGGYFMYDCQAKGHPLFPEAEGASYVLRTTQLCVLHYCIVVTLNVTAQRVDFYIHRVEVMHDGLPLQPEDKQRFLNDDVQL